MKDGPMDASDHLLFMEGVIKRHGLQISLPDVSSSAYVPTIAKCFAEGDDGYSLLAMCMTSALIYHCRESNEYESLLELSDLLEKVIREGEEDYNLETTGRELRSALFWGYLRIGQSDVRLMKASGRLLAALTGGDVEESLRAEAVLSHGRHYG